MTYRGHAGQVVLRRKSMMPGLLDDTDFDPADELTPEQVEAIRQSLRGTPPSNHPRAPVPAIKQQLKSALVGLAGADSGKDDTMSSPSPEDQELSSDSDDLDVDLALDKPSFEPSEPSSPLQTTRTPTMKFDDKGVASDESEEDGEEAEPVVASAKEDSLESDSEMVEVLAVDAGVDNGHEVDGCEMQDGPGRTEQAPDEDQTSQPETAKTRIPPRPTSPATSVVEPPAIPPKQSTLPVVTQANATSEAMGTSEGNGVPATKTTASALPGKDPSMAQAIKRLKEQQEAKQAKKEAAAAEKKATAAAEKKAAAAEKKAAKEAEKQAAKEAEGAQGTKKPRGGNGKRNRGGKV
jgi:hypothetical protein